MKTGKNKTLKMTALAGALFSFLCAAPARGGEYGALAENLARAAKANGITRIVIGQFSASAGAEAEAGFVSEKTTQLLSSGKDLEILDQATLEAYGGAKEGWLSKMPAKQRPQAFIKGSVYKEGEELTIMVKLVNAASGRVLEMMQLRSEARFTELPPVPEINWEAPPLTAPALSDLRDALADTGFDCQAAFREMTRINSAAVDLKARYWAVKMKERGFTYGSLTRNPGSELKDPQVKQRFYELLAKYYEKETAPAIAEAKLKKLEDFMGREDSVIDKCGSN